MNIEKALVAADEAFSVVWLWATVIFVVVIVIFFIAWIYDERENGKKIVAKDYGLAALFATGLGVVVTAFASFFISLVLYNTLVKDAMIDTFNEEFETKYGVEFSHELFTPDRFTDAKRGSIFAVSEATVIDGEMIYIHLVKTGDKTLDVFYTPGNNELAPLLPLRER